MRSTRFAFIVPVAFVALVAAVATACGTGQSRGAAAAAAPAPAASAATLRTITATGTGKAEGTPDLLTISIGVQTGAPKASAALADNNTRTAALIAKLKAGGVADKDLQTSQLSIYPQFNSSPTPVIVGYQVSNMVTAKLRKLDAAGALIDDAASAAGDAARINGIFFSIDDSSALLTTARADAVRQAQARVATMAEAAGVKMGSLRTITDTSVTQPGQYMAVGQAFSAGNTVADKVPLQAGSQRVSIDVQLVYDVNP